MAAAAAAEEARTQTDVEDFYSFSSSLKCHVENHISHLLLVHSRGIILNVGRQSCLFENNSRVAVSHSHRG